MGNRANRPGHEELENGDVEVDDDPDLGRTCFVHVDLGTLCAAVKQKTEHCHGGWHHHAFTDPFQHALVMLVFDEALKYMIGGDHDPGWMNAEAAAYDFEGMSWPRSIPRVITATVAFLSNRKWLWRSSFNPPNFAGGN